MNCSNIELFGIDLLSDYAFSVERNEKNLRCPVFKH